MFTGQFIIMLFVAALFFTSGAYYGRTRALHLLKDEQDSDAKKKKA